ncbi:MAG: ATP-grasp domain-containing protein [Candidatus Riflebacteria bacterium]|nr:ATP-grasp domain-containing protein [Candidatus Riflebacteria bacterium]
MNINLAVSGLNASDSPGPGLGIIKCLRNQTRFNIRIIGLAYDAKEAAIYVQEACDEVYLLPYPSAGTEAFQKRVRTIVQKARINFFLPALDSELTNFLSMEEELSELGVTTFLPTREMIEMRSKIKLQDLCKKAKLKYPKTIEIGSFDQLFPAARKLGFPCLVKGIFYEAVLARNDGDLEKGARSISSRWGFPLLLQQWVDGEEFDIALAGDGKGKILGMTAMKKMQLTEKGKAWGGMSIHSEDLFSCAQRLVKQLQWRGPMEVEIMRNEKTNEYHLIEINPRFPAWIFLSHGAQCNLPEILLRHVYDKIPLKQTPILGKPGTMFMRYSQDMIISMPEYESIMMFGELHRNAPPTATKTTRRKKRET